MKNEMDWNDFHLVTVQGMLCTHSSFMLQAAVSKKLRLDRYLVNITDPSNALQTIVYKNGMQGTVFFISQSRAQ